VIARNFSYNKFLESIDVPLVSGVDTRALTKYIVNLKGSHKSLLTNSPISPSPEDFTNQKLQCNELDRVGQKKAETIIPGEKPIVLINYGMKNAIVENLKGLGFPLISVPHFFSAKKILDLNPRLIFLSNGPGDPRKNTQEIAVAKELLKANIPIRGICMGHQILTLALNGKIEKLPFGQRGTNHPCLDTVTGKVVITSQNHGYTSEESSLLALGPENPLNREIYISHKSLFDKSVEGIATTDHFLKSVQFHPEANPGPHDTLDFFHEIKSYLEGKITRKVTRDKLHPLLEFDNHAQKSIPYKKILIIGSGPIKIGQASEFDYSGTQACLALAKLGLQVILLNSNPATIMTDPEMAYKTYIEPITKDVVKKIILKENVDAVLSTMGGQTALNLVVELEKEGFLRQHQIHILGAKSSTIERTEDREIFAQELKKLGYQTGKRFMANSKEESLQLASESVGYPLIIRRDFALGGRGSALCSSEEELACVFETTDLKFPITLEKSLVGWKEIELEVMVDREGNGVIICSIENIDPCGIHTGDSITVAPAQTISDRCFQQLRSIALHVAKEMGVVAGGANVQFAVNPLNEDEIVVIEMNPRVSRSSALASKATGYPVAKISALLAVGYTLKEILNDITKASPVAFEPTLDYVAIKIPIFPFNKFPSSSKELGPQMRSVGEVLALGGNFNETFLKALRSLEMGLEIPFISQLKNIPIPLSREFIKERLENFHELSLLTCLDALRFGFSVEEIHQMTAITPWFLEQLQQIVKAEEQISKDQGNLLSSPEKFTAYKALGMSDKYLAKLEGITQKEVLQYRMENKIFPVYKSVDTCSGEFNAKTPYFYSSYQHVNEAISFDKTHSPIVVLGSGPNRIGQGIEFDYSCVKSCHRLKEKGFKAIMLNSNPETVSTDYDTSDRLYLTPLYSEDLFDIFQNETPQGVIASFSGQTGIAIREHFENTFIKDFVQINFLGPNLKTLELTEDRKLFSKLLDTVDLAQTNSKEVRGYKNLVNAIIEIGFPVIIRPSYVIGGESMYIFHSFDDIEQLPPEHLHGLQTSDTTYQIENYLEHAFEYDVDLIRDKKANCIFTICEHIEYAGVHSGDSGMISPPVALTGKLFAKIKKISIELANKLEVIGPINFQFAVKDGEVYCVEANPRGSRTLPFLSKAYHLSLPGLATDALLGDTLKSWDKETSPFFCVKQSTFPFDRFIQDNVILGPKMRSTGETFGVAFDKEMAVLKSYLGNYPNLTGPGIILISLADKNKSLLLPYLNILHQRGHQFAATLGTYQYIKKQGIPCTLVSKINGHHDRGIPLLEILKKEDLKMVFNTPMNQGTSKSDGEYIRNTAIAYGIPCFTREENIKAIIESLMNYLPDRMVPLPLQELPYDQQG
jgi:carbamoyl-phosphate synthase large subunit